MEIKIPVYPEFREVNICFQPLFSEYTDKFSSYSDFNLLSLLFWNTDHTYMFSTLNNNLVVKIRDYLSDGYLYSILGENLIDSSLQELLTDVTQLSFVPEVVIKNIHQTDMFTILPDRDNFDYIISTEKITNIEGREFKHLRKCVHSFSKQFPKYHVEPFILSETMDKVAALINKWNDDKEFSNEKRGEEILKLNNFLLYSTYFNCINVGLFVEERLVACIFNEIKTDVVMSHVGISDRNIGTSASMMEYVNAKFFYNKGLLLQNIQQDTGLQGLRAAKLTYNPVDFLKKYIIKPN